jgi:hypothetical protein
VHIKQSLVQVVSPKILTIIPREVDPHKYQQATRGMTYPHPSYDYSTDDPNHYEYQQDESLLYLDGEICITDALRGSE